MSPTTFVILSGALTFGAPIALAIHELIMLRRPPRGPGWNGPDIEPMEPRPPKPLPDCLIPKRLVRTRELEDA
jgi:hypothetical protein